MENALKDNYRKIPNGLIERLRSLNGLNAADYRVYFAVFGECIWGSNCSWKRISREVIQDLTGLRVETVSRSLKKLEALGFIERKGKNMRPTIKSDQSVTNDQSVTKKVIDQSLNTPEKVIDQSRKSDRSVTPYISNKEEEKKEEENKGFSSLSLPEYHEEDLKDFTRGQIERKPAQDHLVMDLDFDQLDPAQRLYRGHWKVIQARIPERRPSENATPGINAFHELLNRGVEEKDVPPVIIASQEDGFWKGKTVTAEGFCKSWDSLRAQGLGEAEKISAEDIEADIQERYGYGLIGMAAKAGHIGAGLTGPPEAWAGQILENYGVKVISWEKFRERSYGKA